MNGFVTIDKADETQAQALHHLHDSAFWQGWDAESFRSFLRDKTVIGFIARPIGNPDHIIGFVLLRQIGDEAEIITIAVTATHRRQGVGYALFDAVLRHLYHQRVSQIFLEVEEKNQAAFALYRRFGFEETGRRKGYYQTQAGRCDALTMRRILKNVKQACHANGDETTSIVQDIPESTPQPNH